MRAFWQAIVTLSAIALCMLTVFQTLQINGLNDRLASLEQSDKRVYFRAETWGDCPQASREHRYVPDRQQFCVVNAPLGMSGAFHRALSVMPLSWVENYHGVKHEDGYFYMDLATSMHCVNIRLTQPTQRRLECHARGYNINEDLISEILMRSQVRWTELIDLEKQFMVGWDV